MLDRDKFQLQLENEKVVPGANPTQYKRGWENGVNYGINLAIRMIIDSPDDELRYILHFVTRARDASITNEELFANQLLSFWTAYCFHEHITIDTDKYDAELPRIWDLLEGYDKPEAYYKNYDEFDLFMGQYLS